MTKREYFMLRRVPKTKRVKNLKGDYKPVGMISKEQLDQEIKEPLVTNYYNGSIERYIPNRKDLFYLSNKNPSERIRPNTTKAFFYELETFL